MIRQFGIANSFLLKILNSVEKLYWETYVDHHLATMVEKMLQTL